MMRERWPDMVVAFDRAQGGGDVAEELEENHGITIVDHGQGTPFDLASMKLGEYVENQKIEWDGPDEFSTQVLSAVAKLVMGGKRWRGQEPDGSTPIDSFDALAMAQSQAGICIRASISGCYKRTAPSKYSVRIGILTYRNQHHSRT